MYDIHLHKALRETDGAGTEPQDDQNLGHDVGSQARVTTARMPRKEHIGRCSVAS